MEAGHERCSVVDAAGVEAENTKLRSDNSLDFMTVTEDQ